jgi:hypothetical protein
MADSVLSGMVFEVTPAGRSALRDVTISLLTCGAANCPPGLTAAYDVQTNEDGAYRIDGVYSGDLNFLWVQNDKYVLVDPTAPGTCPDRCDRVVTVNGETRLDLNLVRR